MGRISKAGCRLARRSWNIFTIWLDASQLGRVISAFTSHCHNWNESYYSLRGICFHVIPSHYSISSLCVIIQLCKARGFLCEVCHSSEVIFPFQVDNVVRCTLCGSCFHRPCWSNPASCPRCQRIARRSQLNKSQQSWCNIFNRTNKYFFVNSDVV